MTHRIENLDSLIHGYITICFQGLGQAGITGAGEPVKRLITTVGAKLFEKTFEFGPDSDWEAAYHANDNTVILRRKSERR